jgi:hypothetical protein
VDEMKPSESVKSLWDWYFNNFAKTEPELFSELEALREQSERESQESKDSTDAAISRWIAILPKWR